MRRTRIKSVATFLLPAVLLAATGVVGTAAPASAHTTNDWVYVYNPIIDGDSVHNDVSEWWARSYDTSPAGHHIVYSNWGWRNDLSMDVFAKASGKRVVTPFGSKTNTGHRVESKVVSLRSGCKSGNLDDGGYLVTVEARDTSTGSVLGRADLMHVDRPQVRVGQVIGGWTTIGFSRQFRYNSCYQVNTTNGIHVHMELINQHRYACYYPKGYDSALTELTRLGIVGAHYGGQRARC